MNLIEKIRKEVIYESDVYRRTAPDHYDFWNEHIKYVYEKGVVLAKNTKLISKLWHLVPYCTIWH